MLKNVVLAVLISFCSYSYAGKLFVNSSPNGNSNTDVNFILDRLKSHQPYDSTKKTINLTFMALASLKGLDRLPLDEVSVLRLEKNHFNEIEDLKNYPSKSIEIINLTENPVTHVKPNLLTQLEECFPKLNIIYLSSNNLENWSDLVNYQLIKETRISILDPQLVEQQTANLFTHSDNSDQQGF